MIARTAKAANAIRIHRRVRDRYGLTWTRGEDGRWRRFTNDYRDRALTTEQIIQAYGPLTTIEEE